MPARPIGEVLLARGVVSRESLAAAWEQRVLFGDRLGTNLLAAHLVDEKELALALGDQHHVHAAYGELLRIDPRALALLTPAVADRYAVVPHHVEGKSLYLLMMDPHDVYAIDAVRVVTKLTVSPVVVCEARMWQLLAEHYRISRSLRPISLDGDPFRAAERRKQQREEQLRAAESFEELTNEHDFYAMYMRQPEGPEAPEAEPLPLVDEVAPAPSPPSTRGVPRPITLPDAERLRPVVIARPEPPAAATRAEMPLDEAWRFAAPPPTDPTVADAAEVPAAAGAHTVIDALSPALMSALAGGAPLEAQGRAPWEPSDEGLPVTPRALAEHPAPVETPLGFAEAERLLDGVHDRDEIARVVLRYALSRFRRACLLTVYEAGCAGWEGVGPDCGSAIVRRFQIRASEQSVFSLVVESRAHYIGPLQKWKAHGPFVKLLGRQLPRSVAVFPVLVRGKVVNLLYGDNGHDEHVNSDVGELLILAQHIARSYESLLKGAAGAFKGRPRGGP